MKSLKKMAFTLDTGVASSLSTEDGVPGNSESCRRAKRCICKNLKSYLEWLFKIGPSLRDGVEEACR